MKVGLFFGSFNPIHNGHLIIGDLIRSQAQLDKVWFVLSPQNPFKRKEGLLDEKIRLDLVKAAVKDAPHLEASDREFSLPQPSYTIDTLDALELDFPNHQFNIIMGSDNLDKLDSWKQSNRLISSHQFLIYPRLGYNNKTYESHQNFQFYDLPIVEISSTEIRKRIKSKDAYQYMIHKDVYNLIQTENLYV